MLTARPHTPPLKSINQILNIKGESNKAKGNQFVLKLLLLAFSLVDGTYQACPFLLLIRYHYVIIIVSIITVFAGVLFVHQPGANHAPRASVTQVNHSVHTLSTFLRIRADPSMQIF